MAVFVPVAVLASGFFASSVSAAAIPAALPIIDPSYVNNGLTEEKVASILNSLNNLDEEKLAKLPSFLTNGKFWEGALTTVGAAAGGIGAWLGVTGGKRSIEDLSDDDKMAALGALLAQSGALNDLDGEKLAKLPGFLTNGKFWEGALTTVGAAAGGIGAWLGATGGKRSINDLSDDDKMAALGALMAQSGALDNLDGEKLAKLPSFLTNGKFWEGALTTVGAAAGGIGAWLGATGGKRSIEELSDEDKEAALKHLVPAIVSAVGGLLGLGAGAYQHHQNGQQKRSIDDLNDEDKEAALKHLIPAIAGAVSGFLGLGAGAYQHHKNGQQKRSINPEELSALFGSGKRSEDSALLARMLDSEFY